MMTLFHVFAQLIAVLFMPVMTEGKRGRHAYPRHSTRRQDTVPVIAIMTREGYETLYRFVSPYHTKHVRSVFA